MFDTSRSATFFTDTNSKDSVLTLNLTQSQNFAAPPYEFSPTIIGFFNFAILVGGLIGLVTAGPLSDWISMKLTKKNRGIREPEMRLLTMIPYVIIMIIGNFVVAYGYEKKYDWKVRIRLLETSKLIFTPITKKCFRSLSLSVTQRQASRLPPYLQLRPPTLWILTNLSRARSSSVSRSTKISGAMDSPSSLPLGSRRWDTSHRS